jgi:predicted dehydrogenase
VNPLRVAVIGAGRLGHIHAQLLQQHADVRLVGVVDPDPAARRRAAEAFRVAAVDHYHELLGNVDAAVVAAPTLQHFTLSRDLLRHGVHLLVEKPLTTSLAEADELIRLARYQRLVLQVGHVERFNPAIAAAAPHLEAPCYFEAVRTSGYSCRSTDIGVVLDLMIHDLDLLLSLVDSAVSSVQAVGATVIGPHEDMAQARITFADGCVANLTASRTSFRAQRTVQVYGRRGMVSLDLAQRTAQRVRLSQELLQGIDVDLLDGDEKEQLRNRLFQDYLPIQTLEVPERNALLDEQRDFLASIRTGRSPRVSGTDARRALDVALRIQQEIAEFERRMRHTAWPATTPALPDILPPRRQAG